MLTAIKLVHTVIWAILAASIVAVPGAGVLHRFGWAAVLTAVILIECGVLALNGSRAARFTDERRPAACPRNPPPADGENDVPASKPIAVPVHQRFLVKLRWEPAEPTTRRFVINMLNDDKNVQKRHDPWTQAA